MTGIVFIGEGPVDLEYIEVSSYVSGASSHSIAANFGTDPGASRRVIVAVHTLASAGVTPTLSSASIGGVTAPLIYSSLQVEGGALTLGTFWIGANPTGTSGNVNVAFSNTVGIVIGVWKALFVQSLTAIDTASLGWAFDMSSPKTINLDGRANGAVLGATTLQHAAGNPNFSAGVTEDYSVTMSGDFVANGGFSLISADETNRAVSITRNTVASWRGGFNAISLR